MSDSKLEKLIETELEELIDSEIKTFTYADIVDIECFQSHRIKPKRYKLALDDDGKEWVTCLLITDHNGENDSPYRAAFDPKYGKFVREVTLENDIPLYIGRYPSLEDLVDEFA